jgi:hypothetical protein
MPPQAPRRPLSIPAIVSQAFRLPWDRRADFVRALALPALAIAAIRVGWWLAGDLGGALRWAAWIAHGAAWVLFAVACHRLVLLDLRGDSVPRVPGWGREPTIFAITIVLTCATVMIAVMGTLMTVGTVVLNISQPAFELLNYPFAPVLGTYIFARMAPALPAAAIGARVNLPEMWRRTRGNGWRLAFVVGALPWALAYVSKFAAGDDPGIAAGIATTALSVALMAVEISALSIAYRMLTAED